MDTPSGESSTSETQVRPETGNDAFLFAEKACGNADFSGSAADFDDQLEDDTPIKQAVSATLYDRFSVSESGRVGMFFGVVHRASFYEVVLPNSPADPINIILHYLKTRFPTTEFVPYPVALESGGKTIGYFVRVPLTKVSVGWLRDPSGRVLLNPEITGNDPDTRRRLRDEGAADTDWVITARAWAGHAPDMVPWDGCPFVVGDDFFRPTSLATVVMSNQAGAFEGDADSLLAPLELDPQHPLHFLNTHNPTDDAVEVYLTMPSLEAQRVVSGASGLDFPEEKRPSVGIARDSFEAMKELSSTTLFLNFAAVSPDLSVIKTKADMLAFVRDEIANLDLPSDAIRVWHRKPRGRRGRNRKRQRELNTASDYKRWTVMLSIDDANSRDTVLRSAYARLAPVGGLVRYAWATTGKKKRLRRRRGRALGVLVGMADVADNGVGSADEPVVAVKIKGGEEPVATIRSMGGDCFTFPLDDRNSLYDMLAVLPESHLNVVVDEMRGLVMGSDNQHAHLATALFLLGRHDDLNVRGTIFTLAAQFGVARV